MSRLPSGTPGTKTAFLSSAEHLGRASTSKPPNDGPLWEEALVGKIRTMSALQKSQALEAVQCHIREHTQVGPQEPCSSVRDATFCHSRAHRG